MGTGGRVTNPENVTATGRDLRTGMKRSITLADAVKRGTLTSFVAASPASPSPPPESDSETPTPDGFGPKCVEFARYSDQDGCWLKTSQGYSQRMLDGSSEEWLRTWPRSGIALSGRICRLLHSEHLISETECS